MEEICCERLEGMQVAVDLIKRAAEARGSCATASNSNEQGWQCREREEEEREEGESGEEERNEEGRGGGENGPREGEREGC